MSGSVIVSTSSWTTAFTWLSAFRSPSGLRDCVVRTKCFDAVFIFRLPMLPESRSRPVYLQPGMLSPMKEYLSQVALYVMEEWNAHSVLRSVNRTLCVARTK